MILFYIDESGTGFKDRRSAFFLLSAIAVKEADWSLVDSKIYALKQEIIPWAKPEDFEIKGRDIRRGEKFFKTYNWHERIAIINRTANLIAELPCLIFAVKVNKKDLPEYVSSDDQMYRLAFWRLLDEIELELNKGNINENGILMVDARSDLHSSLQDRRLIDAYREWIRTRGTTHFIELPWFGFSAFYAGLQLADFCAYMIDFVSNEEISDKERAKELVEAHVKFKDKIHLITIP